MEEKKRGKELLLHVLNHFEDYVGTVMFIGILFLLTLQVVSRFVFNHSFTWTEELASPMFVAMVYCGVASAVTNRKHLRIDALLEAVPFKVKKAMLIISDVIFMAFNVWISYIYVDKLIPTMGRGVTSLLRIPKKFLYAIIPVMLMVTCIRLVQNIIRLSKESPKELGASKPVIDIDALEAEARALKEKEGNN